MIALSEPLAALRAELARVDRAIAALEQLAAQSDAPPAAKKRGRPPKARASEPERAMRAGA
jgi:hypothetical protein